MIVEKSRSRKCALFVRPHPLAPAPLGRCLDEWIKPNIGDMPLSEVNNAALKTLVAKMSEGGLSPKTISDNYVSLVVPRE